MSGTAVGTLTKAGDGSLAIKRLRGELLLCTTIVSEGTLLLNEVNVAIPGDFDHRRRVRRSGFGRGVWTGINGHHPQLPRPVSSNVRVLNSGLANLNDVTDLFNSLTMTGGEVNCGTRGNGIPIPRRQRDEPA